MKITETKIEELQKLGFKRWTKNGKDRLYINATSLGLTYTTYNTGNVSSASFAGEHISNSAARRMLGSKTYIDLVQGVVVSDNATLANAAADLSGLECEEHRPWDNIIKIA
jgi:hypothetical protein